MTIIFAAALEDAVAIGADSLGHDAVTLEKRQRSNKVRRLNSRIAIAKAGYGGPEAEPIWEALMAGPDLLDLDPADAAARLRMIVPPIYERCKARAAELALSDAGFYFVVGGRTKAGLNEVHWLNFKLGDFGGRGPAFATGFGPSADTGNVASETLQKMLMIEGEAQVAPLDLWAVQLVEWGKNLEPHAIGLPVDLEVIDREGAKRYELSRPFTSNPALRCRVL